MFLVIFHSPILQKFSEILWGISVYSIPAIFTYFCIILDAAFVLLPLKLTKKNNTISCIRMNSLGHQTHGGFAIL